MDANEILDLPYVDTHTSIVAAAPDAVWRALGETVNQPWFHVVTAIPGKELSVAGSHPFSTYALIFRLEEAGADRTWVRAETRAEFPGPAGRLYRLLVIGTGGHALVVRRMLTTVGKRAAKGRGELRDQPERRRRR
ncbi:hypothetical protein [Streptomyces sp. AC550_RSS872]|uniref:hypothetical protein n=1 Tax=Streptomyces sp. AC550_RSS872 TaxID=2823689 RepID=UPI001C260E47|nr:hypothetical protein [Streptomyces sp. AC550_RSS872]